MEYLEITMETLVLFGTQSLQATLWGCGSPFNGCSALPAVAFLSDRWNHRIHNQCDSNGLQNNMCGPEIIVETLNDISDWVAPCHMSTKSIYIHGHAELLSEPSLTKSIIYWRFWFTFNIRYFPLYLDLRLPNMWATEFFIRAVVPIIFFKRMFFVPL